MRVRKRSFRKLPAELGNCDIFATASVNHERHFCGKHLTRRLGSLGGSFKNVAGTTAKNPG